MDIVNAPVIESGQYACPMMEFKADDDGLRAWFGKHGYVTVRSVVPRPLIKDLLAIYRSDIVLSQTRFFRQTSETYEINRITGHGQVEQGFLDVHEFQRYTAFSAAACRILSYPRLLRCLQAVSSSEELSVMQSMLFDSNPATPPHQDWWYLDSLPPGRMVAAWIALEDLDDGSGGCYLLPRSMGLHPLADGPGISHSSWLARMREVVEANRDDLHQPSMRAGDVILWDSRIIHGVAKGHDDSRSCRAMTAHYLPDQFRFGNIFGEKPQPRFRVVDGVRFSRNRREYSPLASWRAAMRNAVYDHPRVMRLLRILRR